jgi:hypothetical protein
MTATPDGGYDFPQWTLDGNNAGNSVAYTVTMNQSHVLNAAFVPMESLIYYINKTLAAASWDDLSLHAAVYGNLFGKCDPTAFDATINNSAGQSDWMGVIYAARCAEVMGYWSTNIENKIKSALDNINMDKHLPLCSASSPYFYNTMRYILNAYRYADQLGYQKEKWNVTAGYETYNSIYASARKPFLYGNSTYQYGIGYGPRYYDEAAETMDVFLRFYELGITEGLTKAEQVWNWINNNLWSADHWNYGFNWAGWECEAGSFYLIAMRLNHYDSSVPNMDRILTDCKNRLTTSKFSSPQWSSYVIVHHYPSNPQKRLHETLATYVALHVLYKDMDPTEQANYVSMLCDTSIKAWMGLIYESGLYDNLTSQFKFTSDGNWDNKATEIGAAILTLQGIIPSTGCLALPIFEESYEEQLLLISKYVKLNVDQHTLVIPVSRGQIGFQFNASRVYYNFTSDAVYQVTFALDWNRIVNVTLIEGLSPTLIYVMPSEKVIIPKITFAANIGNDTEGPIMKVDGLNYTLANLPLVFDWAQNTTHQFYFYPSVPAADGTYYWNSTNGLATGEYGTLNVTCSGEITAVYSFSHKPASSEPWFSNLIFGQGRWIFIIILLVLAGIFSRFEWGSLLGFVIFTFFGIVYFINPSSGENVVCGLVLMAIAIMQLVNTMKKRQKREQRKRRKLRKRR